MFNKKTSDNLLIRTFLYLALLLLILYPSLARAGVLYDAYPELKNSFSTFFNQLKDEMVTLGIPEADTDGLIEAWIIDVDAYLQDQLDQGSLNKSKFAQKLFESFITLSLDHLKVTNALINTLSSNYGIGLTDIEKIADGKKELPAEFKPLYDTIEQLYFGTDNNPGNNSGGGGSADTAPTGSGIGPDGGHLIEGGAILNIPKGALLKNTDIIIKKINSDEIANLGTLKLVGDIYEFEPSGQQFSKPVTIILEYDPKKLASGEVPAICVHDPVTGLWNNLGGVLSEVAHTISIEVTHFSKYAVMVVPAQETPNETPNFRDVVPSYWAYKEISDFASKKYIMGYEDNTFLPGANISRAEFAAVLVRALGFKEVNPAAVSFKDVDAGSWYCSYVETVCSGNLMKGYDDGSFKPNENITRQEIAAALVRALGKDKEQAGDLAFSDKESVSGWARNMVSIAVAEGLIQGYPDNTFGPQKKSTRAEAVSMFSRMLGKNKK